MGIVLEAPEGVFLGTWDTELDHHEGNTTMSLCSFTVLGQAPGSFDPVAGSTDALAIRPFDLQADPTEGFGNGFSIHGRRGGRLQCISLENQLPHIFKVIFQRFDMGGTCLSFVGSKAYRPQRIE